MMDCDSVVMTLWAVVWFIIVPFLGVMKLMWD